MSLRRAMQLRTLFTSEQHLFIAEKKIEGSRTPTEWIDFFDEIVEFDSHVDEARTKVGNTMIGLGIAIFILGFISFGFTPLFILVLLLVISFLVAWGIYAKLQRVDIPNRMREFVFPLIKVLQNEMDETDILTLKANFKTGLTTDYQVGTDKKEYHAKRRTDNLFYYVYDVLELSGRLADGNSVLVHISQNARKNKIGKYNPRGKYKTKEKYKIKTLTLVSLAVKKENYQLTQLPKDAKLILPTKQIIEVRDKVNKFTLTTYTTQVDTVNYPIPSIQKTLAPIGLCYSILKQVA